MEHDSIDAKFRGLKAELVDGRLKELPGETHYFLSHERRYLSDLETVLRLYQQGEILEVGAYPFFFTAILQRIGLPVTGVDLHPWRARSLIGNYDLQIVACDIEKHYLPFRDEGFGYVLFNELLEHLRVDPLFALSEANRVLKSDGILILTTPNLYFIKTVLKFFLGRGFNDPIAEFSKLRSIGHMGHVREYSTREVQRFMLVSGFRVLSHEMKQYSYPKNLFGLASRPLLALLPIFRGYQMIVARKVGRPPQLHPL